MYRLGADSTARRRERDTPERAEPSVRAKSLSSLRSWPWLMPVSFLAVSFLLALPLWTSARPRLLGYGADSAMHLWFLDWYAYALGHGLNPFITSAATVPHPTNLLWNNADPVLAIFAWPLTQLLGGAHAIDALFCCLVGLSAAAMAWQLRPHLQHASSAWLGGLLFGFGPFALSQLAAAHLTWVTTATVPLGWWVGERCWRSLRERSRRGWWGLALGAWLALQYWASKEILADCALLAVLLGLVYGWHRRREIAIRLRAATPMASAAGLACLALLAVPLAIQLSSSIPLARPTLESTQGNVVDLLAFFLPGYNQLLASPATTAITRHFSGQFLETDAYLGLPLLALALWVGITQRGRPLVRFGVLCAGLAAVLALGPWLHVAGHRLPLPLPWMVLEHLPLYAKAIPSRMTLFVLAGVACLLAAGWDLAVERLRVSSRLALGLVVLLPLLPSAGLVQGIAGFPVSLPRAFTSGPLLHLPPGSAVVTVPMSTTTNHALPMYWQAESGFRYYQTFGYLLHAGAGGVTTYYNAPSPLERLVNQLTVGALRPAVLDRRAVRRQLRLWHVRAMVVTPRRGFARDVRVLTDELGFRPRLVAGSAVWLDPGRIR